MPAPEMLRILDLGSKFGSGGRSKAGGGMPGMPGMPKSGMAMWITCDCAKGMPAIGAMGAPGISGTGGMAGTLLASGALLGIADGHCTMCTSAARAEVTTKAQRRSGRCR